MENQKVDNTLNLAVDATPEEREKSLELDVGYHPADREWDIIIKYSGNIDDLRSETVRITPLLNQYAVVRIPQSELDAFANLPQGLSQSRQYNSDCQSLGSDHRGFAAGRLFPGNRIYTGADK